VLTRSKYPTSAQDVYGGSRPTAATALSLDHLVITVSNLDATIEFYKRILGMKHTSFVSPSSPDVQRHALSFGPHKINLHVLGKEFEPKAKNVIPGSADLCFSSKRVSMKL
jgi:hypothetical protein